MPKTEYHARNIVVATEGFAQSDHRAPGEGREVR